jgi:hypothetical protein
MNKRKIAEGNKAICEYLKFKESKTNVYEVPNCWPDGPKTGYTEFTIWNIGFERDWNMLMPVVEIISKIPLIGATDVDDTCYPRTFGMPNNDTGQLMYMVRFNGCYLAVAPTLIEATWLAVVDFVTAIQVEPSLKEVFHIELKRNVLKDQQRSIIELRKENKIFIGIIDKFINDHTPSYSIEEKAILKDLIDGHLGKGAQ